MGKTITLSREVGCHGEWIAAEVARRMDLRLMGSEIMNEAIRAGIPKEVALESEEGRRSWIERAIDFLRGQPPVPIAVSLAGTNPIDAYVSTGLQQGVDYRAVLESMIFDLAQGEDMLLVGRAGQMVLRGKSDTFHVRVWAPPEMRAAVTADRLGLPVEEARRQMEDIDGARATYLRRHYHTEISDSTLYDLCLNTGVVSREQAADLIVQVAQTAFNVR